MEPNKARFLSRLLSRLLPSKQSPGDAIDVESGPSARAGSRDYRGGASVWKDLAIAAGVVVVGIVVTSPGFLDRLIHGSPAPVSKGEVLVVSAKDMDLLSVSQTASTRGYRVSIAADADDGVARLQNAGNQVAFIVVDGDMAGANRVISAAKSSHPNARLVVLSGARQAGDVSSRLLEAGVR